MSTALVWNQSRLVDGIEARGAFDRLYIVMTFPGRGSTAGFYLASHRSSFSQEPHYFKRFPLDPKGLMTAKAACQACEDHARIRAKRRAKDIKLA